MNQPKTYHIHRQYFDKRSHRGHTVYLNLDSAKYMDRVPLPFLYRRRGSITDIDPAKDEKIFSQWVNHVRQFMRVVCKAHGVDHGHFCWVLDEIPADLALAQRLAEIHPFNSRSPISVVCWVAEINRLLLPVMQEPVHQLRRRQQDFGIKHGEIQTETRKLEWDEWQLEADRLWPTWKGTKRKLYNDIKKNLDLSDSVETIRKRIKLSEK